MEERLIDCSFDEQLKTIRLLEEYGVIYRDFLKSNISKEFLEISRNDLKYIPNDLVEAVEFFAQLDYEYDQKMPNDFDHLNHLLQTGKIISPWSKVKDKTWRGYWLHASGLDLDLFLNWLKSALKYTKYQTETLEYWFKQVHPKVKYVPYSITIANKMFEKYYKE